MTTDTVILTVLIGAFIAVLAAYIRHKQRELKRFERQCEDEIEEARIQARRPMPPMRYYYYDPETKSSKSKDIQL